MAIRKRNKTWYMYWREHGRIVERSLGTCTEQEARDSERSLRQIIYARRQASRLSAAFGTAQYAPAAISAPAKQREKDRVKLSAMFALAAKRRELTRDTETYWQKFCREIGVAYADQVTPAIVQQWMDAEYGGKSAKTYNNVLTMLRGVFKLCLIDCGLEASPLDRIVMRRNDTEEHFRDFTKQEQNAILRYVKDHPYWECLTMIAAYTGLRLESCERLAPSHISDGVITITPGKTARFGKAVAIPLLPKLAEYLGKLSPATPDSPYCTCFEKHRKKGKERFYKAMLDELGIADNEQGRVGFHSWRDTFITWMAANDVPEIVMRGVAGHRSRKMTDLYNHDTTAARRQFDRLAAINGDAG